MAPPRAPSMPPASHTAGAVPSPTAPGRARTVLGRFLRVAVSLATIVLLVVAARHVQWGVTWREIRTASPQLLVAALVVNLVSLALKGVRWWLFLRRVGAPSFGLALKATFAGAGLNNVLVANGGEAAQVVFVARATHVSHSKVLATLTLDRLTGFVGYVLVVVLGLWVLPLPGEVARWRPEATATLAALAALMIVLYRMDIGEGLAATGGRRFEKLRGHGRTFMHTISHLSTGASIVQALLLSVGSWVLQIATFHLTAAAVHFPITLTGSVAAVIAVNLGFVVHLTPGNVGLFQALYAAAAVAFGFNQSAAIAVAILIQAQQILPVTVIGIALAPEFIFKRHRPLDAAL
ncbi:MAG TPA: lysylphosphatidylglycerol synthase transmembrane domain-containing protein [Gemmatimonadaceae bacterium]|nr:lysylphosphatidylglycerol synthase transmembrane domain-containing protein [Gemmatimonadaceae bacterium]